VISSLLVLATALLLTPRFHNLPEATLAAIILRAVSGLMNVKALQRYWRLKRSDFLLALTALTGVLVVDVLPGLLIAVALSLFALMSRASRPRLVVLGKLPAEGTFADIEQHSDAVTTEGLFVVRLDAPLIFANAQVLHDQIRHLLQDMGQETDAVIIDLEANADLDVTSVEMLSRLTSELNERGVSLYLTCVRSRARGMLDRAGVTDAIGESHLFPSIRCAVDDFRAHLDKPRPLGHARTAAAQDD
jgi:MFS superfamily sulfate permease-like transporter